MKYVLRLLEVIVRRVSVYRLCTQDASFIMIKQSKQSKQQQRPYYNIYTMIST